MSRTTLCTPAPVTDAACEATFSTTPDHVVPTNGCVQARRDFVRQQRAPSVIPARHSGSRDSLSYFEHVLPGEPGTDATHRGGQRALIVDPRPGVRRQYTRCLEPGRFLVQEVRTGAEALCALAETHTDLVVSSCTLTDLRGAHLCRLLRRQPETANIGILLIGAFDEAEECADGIDSGADDFVLKPIRGAELLVRAHAIAQRSGGLRAFSTGGNPLPDAARLSSGPFNVDLVAHRASVDGVPVALTNIEYRLLATFLSRPGQAFTRAELLVEISNRVTNPSASRAIDTHVNRLRSKLGNASMLIKTIHGHGYIYDESARRFLNRVR